MTPLFWIALTWVLATCVVGRLPLHQRFIPGGLLMVTAVPILLSMWVQIGFLPALLGLVAMASLYPNPLRLALARYRGQEVQINGQMLRYMVVPGEL